MSFELRKMERKKKKLNIRGIYAMLFTIEYDLL